MAKHTGWSLLLSFVLLVALGSGSARAQDPEETEPGAEPLAETEELAFSADQEQTEQADEILEDEAEMLAGEGYFYDPGNRRDPFKSLLAARERLEFRGPRPEGIPGLLIDEIDLTGIFITGDGPVAQVASADQEKSYLLRVGDQLYDGDVVGIARDEAVFKQIVDDPAALKPFREVVKKLNP